jgi:hypothetical protein
MDIKIKKVEFVSDEENPEMYTPVVTIAQPSFADMVVFAQEVFGVKDAFR